MSLEFYRFLHVAGLIVMFGALSGMCFRVMAAGDRNYPERKWLAALHGVGWLALFVAGFGLSGKGGFGFPSWVLIKLALLVVLGVAPVAINRKLMNPKACFFGILFIGIVAAWLAQFKPMIW